MIVILTRLALKEIRKLLSTIASKLEQYCARINLFFAETAAYESVKCISFKSVSKNEAFHMMDQVLAIKFELCLAPSSNLSPPTNHFLAHNAPISPSPIIPIFMD